MSIVEVAAGVCGFSARIACEADETYAVTVRVESDCPRVQELAKRLDRVAILSEMGKPLPETSVYRAAGESRLHIACPVPAAMLKGIEVAAGLALPADAHITVRRA